MRKPNTNCSYCQLPIYRRPCYISKQKSFSCKNCRSLINSKTASLKNKSEYLSYIESWKNNFTDGMSGQTNISAHIRRYLFIKYDSKCCKCGWNEVNLTTKKIPLEVNHIDGNYKNNMEENLELVCPNCHSLTSNFKSLNRGKGRIRKKES